MDQFDNARPKPHETTGTTLPAERRLNKVTLGPSIGQGKESTVYIIVEDPTLVAKNPNNPGEMSWADNSVSIPAYQERMYHRVRKIPSAQPLTPDTFYISHSMDNKEVIITDHLNPTGHNVVFAMEDFSPEKLDDRIHVSTVVEKVERSGLKMERLEEFIKGARRKLGEVLDDAMINGLVIPTDAFLLVVDSNREPSLSINDFGSIVDANGWEGEKTSHAARISFINTLSSLNVLKNLLGKQKT